MTENSCANCECELNYDEDGLPNFDTTTRLCDVCFKDEKLICDTALCSNCKDRDDAGHVFITNEGEMFCRYCIEEHVKMLLANRNLDHITIERVSAL